MWFECSYGRIDEGGRHTKSSEEYTNKAHLQKLYNEKRLYKSAFLLARKLGIPPVVHVHPSNFEWFFKHADVGTLSKKWYRINHWYFQESFEAPSGLRLTIFDLWKRIVEQYTTRQLHELKDVLPAVAGIAEAFQQTHGDRYIAGMWQSDIIRSLAWSAGEAREEDDSSINLPKERPYLAPSWSWASIKSSGVRFRTRLAAYEEVDSRAKFIEVQLATAGPSQFGRLSYGHIVIRAPFIDIPNAMQPDVGGPLQLIRRYIHIQLTTISNFTHEYHQQHHGYPGQTFGILHLFNYRDRFNMKHQAEPLISALLLESCKDGSYRRVGGLQFRKEYGTLQPYEVFLTEVLEEFKHAPLRTRTIKMV